jgi:predicted HicB family RNase H-like nuclease
MARPKGRSGQSLNLYLPESVTAEARRMAFERNQSLSQFVAELLAGRIKRAEVARAGK